ncbi:DUF6084 family protein [Amycolatopsis decaplanina]|uniref:Uncharacterized protein n=1 Tax=Amycolatopsis decaplanina DSM 44594 TaxID=1284240 RepID=M2WU00_9PSEU|nr:DUF6084 family protein [Amycolatopsis decaplanina]EME52241.1 hypothetical protein H074_34046 [Amycolatopsis decaplanina DSM 44594]
MAELVFDCIGAEPERYGVVPSLTLRLRITETSGERVEAIALRCQIRIEPHRRRYSAEEAEQLRDLFGDTSRWAETVKPMQFITVSAMVPRFTGNTTVDLPVPVTYDLEIASTKYFNSVSDGVIPLLLLFSGTVFGISDGRLSVRQVPWSKEASYELPVKVWRETVDLHFPGSAWLRIDRETLAALQRYKSRHALPTWDGTVAALLDDAALGHKESREGT